LSLEKLKVMHSIEVCRTAYLGGHLEQCDNSDCGHERPAYNSCRNRHCPKCQSLAKARWLEARNAELLPVGYFHAVFTLPHELNPLILWNKELAFRCLFHAVAQTLQRFALDPRSRLGGKLGFIAVLHTWDQKLLAHFHLHCIIPAGVLSPDGARWIHTPKKFLFPVRALAAVFRGKYLESLKNALAQGKLRVPGATSAREAADAFAELLDSLYRKDWIVYAKPPFGGPRKVLDYLGRYVHRVAISNDRIANVEDGTVVFRFRDRNRDNAIWTMSLPAEEFLRRFLLHSLPASFVRIRHFGFLAHRAKSRELRRCRELLGAAPHVEAPKASTRELLLQLTGKDVTRCPRCKTGRMRVVAELPPIAAPRPPARPAFCDSS